MSHPKGILLINLGTPQSYSLPDVKSYLRTFLMDPYVIQLPWILRKLLVEGFILPFRSKQSAKAYQAIWSARGSPLRFHSEDLQEALQSHLPDNRVALGMRYGHPSIEHALQILKDCSEITLIPLFPQYTKATNQSAIDHTLKLMHRMIPKSTTHIISSFYHHPQYLQAMADNIKRFLPKDHFLLMSYHGIPEAQLKPFCTRPCQQECAQQNPTCYRSQCFMTSREIAARLNLPSNRYATSFQSRLGRMPWIQPYTQEFLRTLIEQKQKNLAIACPSFVADCLETLEEIAIRLKAEWHALGGQSFVMIPCLNQDKAWVEALKSMVC